MVGGVFELAGAVTARNVAIWDGTDWHGMRDGLDNRVIALKTYQGDVYAGGDFVTDGGVAFYYHIARWDGEMWCGVGGGMSGGYWPAVQAFELFDGKLIVGGQFLEAGGVSAPYIASWDGSMWEPVGIGTDDWVNTLSIFNDCLVIGGAFHNAGDVQASHLAQWDGSAWNGYGDGLQDWVNAVAPDADRLYVGGLFHEAGGSVSHYMARWDYDPTMSIAEQTDFARASLRLVSPNPVIGRMDLSFVLQGPAHVQLDLIDVQGRTVGHLHSGPAGAGVHHLSVSLDQVGRMSPGVYFARLVVGREEHSIKFMVAD